MIGPKVTSLIQAVKAVAPIVVWVLEPGKSGSITGLQEANRKIEDLCRIEGAYVLDLSGVITNPADGTMTAAYSADGVHPNPAGAKLMGAKVVDWLNLTFPGMGRFRTTIANAETTNLITKASPPVGAAPFTGWTAGGAGTGITWSSVAPAASDPITTNWIRATMSGSGSGASNQIFYNPTGVTAGDRLLWAVWVKTVGMTNATVTTDLFWTAGGSLIPLYQGDSSGSGGDTVGLWTGHKIITSTAANYGVRLLVTGDGAGNGIVEFGAPTLLNLTALGLDALYADQ